MIPGITSVTFIKLGGSLITDKTSPLTLNASALELAVRQIKAVKNKYPDMKILLGHGAGSFGHFAVKKYSLKNGCEGQKGAIGMIHVRQAVSLLNYQVTEMFLKHEIPILSLQPSSMFATKNGSIKHSTFDIIISLLKGQTIPCLYGDIVLDTKKGCHILSTEMLFSMCIDYLLSEYVQIDKIIYLTHVAGVYDNKKNVIHQITPGTYDYVKPSFEQVSGYDVTGGMKHKIESAINYAKRGVDTYITRVDSSQSLMHLIEKDTCMGTKITTRR